MPAGTGIAPPRCPPPPDGGTIRHVNNSLPGPLSDGSVHGNGSRQPDNWLSALAEPFVTVLAHGNGVIENSFRTRLAKTKITQFNGRNTENVVLFRSQGEGPGPPGPAPRPAVSRCGRPRGGDLHLSATDTGRLGVRSLTLSRVAKARKRQNIYKCIKNVPFLLHRRIRSLSF